MKAYSIRRIIPPASITLLVLIFSSCSPTRFLTKDQALVKKVKLKGIEKKYEEQVYGYVQKDIRPNSWFYLALYNLVNTKNGHYRTDRIKNVGEAPHLLDSTLVEISRTQIQKYLQSKGFFKASVEDSIWIKKKKAYITFIADRGPMYRVRNFTYHISDSAIRNIYANNRSSFARIKSDKRYDADSIMYEINSTYQLMKQNGYFDFDRQYIHVDVDTSLNSNQADVFFNIYNPVNGGEHKVYTIDTTSITIRTNAGSFTRRPDSALIDSQYLFRDYSHRFKPKALSHYIFFRKGDIYNIDNENLTYDRLYELNVFKNIKIDYRKNADSVSLHPIIDAVPSKKMNNRIEGEYTFNSGRNGFNIGNTYTNRNLFGGAEQLEVKLRYGILYDSRISKGNLFKGIFNRDIQIGANLIFPKLLIPFRTDQTGVYGLSHTTLSSSVQMFDQTNAFYNRIFINSLTYDWTETRYKVHTFTPLNIEYRIGRFDPAFRDSLSSKGYEYYIRTNDKRYFSLGSQYSFTYNTIKLSSYDNFVYFRGLIDVAGNAIGLLSNTFNLKRDSGTGERTILGLPYLQYAKTELDLRLYRSLGNEQQLVIRLNPGVGLPYGNTKDLPFEKNFFAGGSSGIRAWQARTLGPGNYNREILDTTGRKNLRNLDQLGEIKFEGNLEYRFKMLNNFLGAKLRGAAFADAGNIWRVRAVEANPGGEFDFNKFLGQMAIGTGFGLRFDVEYFVFRFDVGLKVKDPQFPDDPWVIRHLFNDKKAFQNDFNSTHYPDKYHFLQYNFGIGMPF